MPKLVKWSQEHNEHVRRGLVNRDVESPVQVIVRFPCIAMRLPGPPSMVSSRQCSEYFLEYFSMGNLGFLLWEL